MPHRAMFDDGFSNSFLDADVIKAHTNHLVDGDDEYDINNASETMHHAHPQGSLSPQDQSFLSALSTGRNSLSGSAHSPSGNSFSSLSPSTAWSALMPLQSNNAASVGGGHTNQGPMLGGGDEWALGDTFDQGELDMLFFNDKSGGEADGTINMDWLLQLPAQGQQQGQGQLQAQAQGQGQDTTFDMLNLPPSPTAVPNMIASQYQAQPNTILDLGQLQMQNQQHNPSQSQNGFSMGQLDLGGMAGAAAWAQIQAEQMRQAQQLRDIQRQQQMQFLEAQMSSAAAVLNGVQAQGNGNGSGSPGNGVGSTNTAVEGSGNWMGDANAVAGSSTGMNRTGEAVAMNKEPSSDALKETKKRGRPGRKPKQPSPDSPIPEPGPMGGKHNKTERRYRQKVQAAQADLRDAVPALRVLYGTSTPEQLATTDVKLADGSVDGLPEVSRPNASAKATILSGARQYIELLQDRSASLQRKVQELEAYRLAVGGSADLERWRADFAAREQVKLAQIADSRRLIRMDYDDEGGESEDEEQTQTQTKKRKKPASSSDGAAARVFAAFAMSFSLVPSASTLLSHHPDIEITPGRVLAGSATPTQVIARLPLITAEHVHALIKRMVPLPIAQALVPSPGAMVDWTWRILVAVILLLILGPIFQKWIGSESDSPRGAGNVVQMVKDAAGVDEEDREEWDEYAGAIAGRDIVPSRLTRAHVLLRMHKTADSAYSLALLALLQPRIPFTRTVESIWQSAQARLTTDDPAALRSVLQLPFEEARSALLLVPPTRTPLTAIAEQVALVHLSDLYSAYFVHLVQRTTSTPTMLSMSASLDTRPDNAIAKDQVAMEQELRHILRSSARGTVAHALALVLVGITNLTSGQSSTSAQAALASSLAGEEMRGAPSSVRAMLELLYPGFAASTQPAIVASTTALALDSVANACIAYIGLLVRYRALNNNGGRKSGRSEKGDGVEKSRKERQEVSKYVAKAAGQIRVLLSKARCVTGDVYVKEAGQVGGREEQGEFEDAKEKLVEALAIVGRRASSRAMGRDEDSGLEGDLEEL